MSAKKRLSSMLRNLMFMQCATVAQKVEEKDDAEVEMDTEVVEQMANDGGSAHRFMSLGSGMDNAEVICRALELVLEP